MVPAITKRSSPPRSTMPNPVTALPGSTPSTRTPYLHHQRPRKKFLSRGELRHHFIIDIEVGRHALHVIVVFEFFHHPEYLLGSAPRDLDSIFGHHRDFRTRHRDAGLFDRIAHGREILRRGHHLVAFFLADNVVGARLE